MSLDDLQAQLRGALDQQFATLKQHYEQAVADARKQAAADGERLAGARVAAARAEWDQQVDARLAAARAEGQQQAVEYARAQQRALEQQLEKQLEQTVQHAVNSVKRGAELELEALRRRLDEEVQAERQRGQVALEDERRRAQEALEATKEALDRAHHGVREEQTRAAAELDAIKQLLEAEIESARDQVAGAREEMAAARQQIGAAKQDADGARAEAAAAQAEAGAARDAAAQAREALARANDTAAKAAAAAAKAVVPVAPAVPAALTRLPEAVRAVGQASSLSEILEALLHHGGVIAGRAALFLINGDRLKAWKANGIPDIDVQTVESSITGRDLLARAIQSGQPTPASAAVPAPPFARLTGEQAVAVPLMIAGRAAAVLYADTGGAAGAPGWTETIDLVTRHAAAAAALRAALRTFDVLRGGDAADAPAAGNGEEAARRYARLLVSEIKLYNEGAVRVGRQQRDLRRRLREEIDRALRLYEERVPAAVGGRDQMFQQELVQTLADGDPSLLGH